MQAAKSQLKTSLAHLPPNKQKELAAIQEIIRKHVPAEMIILFGSYARGDWVEDSYREDGTTYEYISDFDILVVSKKEIDPMDRRWRAVEAIIERRPLLTKAAIINHDISFLNEKIRHNYYFFVDIVREGIMLYDSGKYELAAPQKLTPKKRLEKAEDYFAYWLEKGDESYRHYGYAIKDKGYNKAAFELHQATENYYASISLVFTDYKPKTHDLKDLCRRANKIHKALQGIFPCQTEEEEYRFELLRRAYVEARYDKNYRITAEELQYLAERVQLLRALTDKLCQEEIAELQKKMEKG